MIVFEDSTPVEIQVRTKLQDKWAQISEKLGDLWGRGLRYGQGPDLPDAPAVPGSEFTRRQVVEKVAELAENIAAWERVEYRYDKMVQEVADAKEQAQAALDSVLETLGALGGAK